MLVSMQCQRDVLRDQLEMLVPCVQFEVILDRVLCDHQIRDAHLVNAMFETSDLHLD